jgi:hypothetical protein
MGMISAHSAAFACFFDAGFIPAFRWASTGDRYLLKLFKDYVFHT